MKARSNRRAHAAELGNGDQYRLLSKQEASLDIARSDYEAYAISGGVRPSPLLSRYVRQ